MKGTIARTNELRGVGYYKVSEIAEMLEQDSDHMAEIFKSLNFVPFEDYFYNEYQIQLIKIYLNIER